MSASFPPPPPPPGPGEEPPTGGSLPPPSGDPYAAPAPGNAQAYPPPSGYGAMPEQAGVPAGPVTRPPAMDRAVLLMRVGAVLSLLVLVLGLVTGLTQSVSTKRAIVDAAAKQGKTLTPNEVDSLFSVSIASAVVLGILGIGLWLWMASANGKGRSWARIVATILFGLSVLVFLLGLSQTSSAGDRVLSLVSVLVGAAAIFFMYQKESTAFYRAASAPRV